MSVNLHVTQTIDIIDSVPGYGVYNIFEQTQIEIISWI